MLESKWQWIDNRYGPMGWFTDAEKTRHEGTAEFSNGHWRPLSQQEVASMGETLKSLAREQA